MIACAAPPLLLLLLITHTAAGNSTIGEGGCIKGYKENDDIEATCKYAFRGDSPMKMLFRTNAKPEECPFDAPSNFTYTAHDGSCTSRISSMTACSTRGKFRFLYQACPELPNSETHVDELECIAHWNSFGVEFFAVRITNSSITGPNIIFRCLIHQKTALGGRLGISADSSCSELTDLSYAGTTLEYIQGSTVKPQCHFPSFLNHHHHSSDTKQWISMATGSTNRFLEEQWIEMLNGENYSMSLCLEVEDLGSAQRIMAHITQRCTSGYQCFKIKRKHKNVLEIARSDLMEQKPTFCDVFRVHALDTLVLANAQVTRCPVSRRHSVAMCANPIAQFGCTYEHELIIHNCNNISSEKFSCLGHWREDEVQYIVTRDHTSSELVCYSYSSYPDGSTRIRSYHHAACHPGSLEQHYPQHDLSVTNYDSCSPSSRVSKKAEMNLLAVLSTVLSFAVVIRRL